MKVAEAQISAVGPQALTVGGVAARASEREAQTIQALKTFRPAVEVYLQRLSPAAGGELTVRQDAYLLGRFNWFKGPRLQDFGGRWDAPEMSLTGIAGERLGFRAHGFAATLSPDWRGLDPSRYDFTLVRQESLGEARCFVMDVAPKKGDDGFAGRVWIESRTYQIVRFNGINQAAEREHFGRAVRFNVDSWRANVLPGLWLPAYAYIEEATGRNAKAPAEGSFRSQIRLWGYDPRPVAVTPATEDSADAQDEAARLDRLARARLLATPGAVEDVLETVVSNLLVTNDLSTGRRIRVRVLLTAPLDSFSIGHTLVVSRGLVDVLPDEATLAFMLAHELAHVVLGHRQLQLPVAAKSGSAITGDALLEPLRTARTQAEEAEASTRALQMLQKSPYKDGQESAEAFLGTLTSHAGPLPNFIQSGIAGQLNAADRQRAASKAAPGGPDFGAAPAALPPGSRLALDPWSSRLSLIPTAAQAAPGRGLAPLVITPLMPHVAYAAVPALDYRP